MTRHNNININDIFQNKSAIQLSIKTLRANSTEGEKKSRSARADHWRAPTSALARSRCRCAGTGSTRSAAESSGGEGERIRGRGLHGIGLVLRTSAAATSTTTRAVTSSCTERGGTTLAADRDGHTTHTECRRIEVWLPAKGDITGLDALVELRLHQATTLAIFDDSHWFLRFKHRWSNDIWPRQSSFSGSSLSLKV